MKRILLVATICFVGFSAMGSSLEMQVSPHNPLLIISGPSAPSFFIQNINIKWNGRRPFQVLAISVNQKAAPGFSCHGSSTKLNDLFAGVRVTDCKGQFAAPALTSNGVEIPGPADSSCPLIVKTQGFFCERLPIPLQTNPFAIYNIPSTVSVTGSTIDDSGTLRNLVISQDIVVQ